jgi:photosystem II stability/assembly factor-like uncharacterized protein
MKSLTIIACVILAACVFAAERADADASPIDLASRYRAEVINPTLSGGLRMPQSDTLLLWGSDGAIWRSEKPGQWTRAHTRIDADLRAMAANADGSVLIAVGEHGAILRSTDGGRSWSSLPSALSTEDLRAVVHHGPGNVWIAAGAGASILRSLDDGRSWSAVPSALRLTFETLASDPSSDTLLIGGEDGVIGLSKDQGATWRLTRIEMPGERTPIAGFHRLDADVLVARSAYGRVLVSRNRGESWQLHETGARGFFTSGAVARDQTLWLATHTGELWRSSQGKDFHRVTLDLEQGDRYISSVHYDPNTEAIIIVGHGGLLARARGRGTDWQQVALPEANLETLIGGATGRYVASGEGGLIMESLDAGVRWQTVSPALNHTLREVVALPDASTFVAVGALGAVLRSMDGGGRWRSVDVRYPNANAPPTLRALHIDVSSGALLAAGPPGTIMRSIDSGTSWRLQHWRPLEAEEAFPWLLDTAGNRSVVALEARGKFYVSHDSGASWQRRAVKTDREFWHGATLHTREVSVVAGQKGVAAVSRDRGASWQVVDTDVPIDLYGSFADERTAAFFLMGNEGVLLRSTDLGQTWQRLASGVTSALRRMLRVPNGSALLAFGAHGAIIRSEDGISWRAVRSSTASELRKSILERDTGNIILVGEHGAAIISRDSGSTWQALATNTRRDFRGAAIDARGRLVAVGERIVRLVRTDAVALNSRSVSRVE